MCQFGVVRGYQQGYGKRNFHEKFASTVFTDVYEEDVVKGPKNPDNSVVRKNDQIARRH